MENQLMFNLIITISGALGGWMLKVIWDALNDLKKDLKDINYQMHTDFVRKEDYREDINDIKDMLNKIFDKLEKKADKK
jgi:thiaminase